MNYSDHFFEKQGYEKEVENERVVIYSMTDSQHFEHVFMLHNDAGNAPAYFHFSVEKYTKAPDGSVIHVRIKDVEYENLKNKAHEMMNRYIQPAVREEKKHIIPHAVMTCGIPRSGGRGDHYGK